MVMMILNCVFLELFFILSWHVFLQFFFSFLIIPCKSISVSLLWFFFILALIPFSLEMKNFHSLSGKEKNNRPIVVCADNQADFYFCGKLEKRCIWCLRCLHWLHYLHYYFINGVFRCIRECRYHQEKYGGYIKYTDFEFQLQSQVRFWCVSCVNSFVPVQSLCNFTQRTTRRYRIYTSCTAFSEFTLSVYFEVTR